MEFQKLLCFVAVAQEQHFGRAADRLRLTTSPVSRAIKDLERDLGGDLFVRGYHQVELTAMGRHLLSRVEPILAELALLRTDMRSMAYAEAQTLRIGGSPFVPTAVMESVVRAARQVDPTFVVELSHAPSRELCGSVASGQIALAVTHLPVSEPDLSWLPVLTYTMQAVLRADDALASRPELRTADLADHTFVVTKARAQPAAYQHMIDAIAAHGVGRVEVVPPGDVVSFVAKLRSGGFFGFVPRESDIAYMVQDEVFAKIPVVDLPVLRIGVVSRPGSDARAKRIDEIMWAIARERGIEWATAPAQTLRTV